MLQQQGGTQGNALLAAITRDPTSIIHCNWAYFPVVPMHPFPFYGR